ncbi:MAG: heterodisulfide reductase-related iron-sulfur binding cluster [Candidatus Binatia bacterium]
MESKKAASRGFKKMTKEIRLLTGMQVSPEEIKRLTGRQDQRKKHARVVFWIGCNLPRTSHLVLALEDILERLDVDCEVLGGQDNCCGIVHFREGDNDTGNRVVRNTVRHMERLSPKMVLAWCPTCHLQFNEILLGFLQTDFVFQHVSEFLANRLALLNSKWQKRIEKKVAIHEHKGVGGVTEHIRKLVAAIPGITIVEVPQLSTYGYMCSRLAAVQRAREDAHRRMIEMAMKARVDVLVTPYHSCQRDFCVEERNHPFEVKNFVTLLGEALGIQYQDQYKKFRILGDEKQIMNEAEPYIRQNKLKEDEVRRVIKKQLI